MQKRKCETCLVPYVLSCGYPLSHTYLGSGPCSASGLRQVRSSEDAVPGQPGSGQVPGRCRLNLQSCILIRSLRSPGARPQLGGPIRESRFGPRSPVPLTGSTGSDWTDGPRLSNKATPFFFGWGGSAQFFFSSFLFCHRVRLTWDERRIQVRVRRTVVPIAGNCCLPALGTGRHRRLLTSWTWSYFAWQ